MAEKRETIGSDLSPDSDEVLQRNLSEFDNMIKQIVSDTISTPFPLAFVLATP